MCVMKCSAALRYMLQFGPLCEHIFRHCARLLFRTVQLAYAAPLKATFSLKRCFISMQGSYSIWQEYGEGICAVPLGMIVDASISTRCISSPRLLAFHDLPVLL